MTTGTKIVQRALSHIGAHSIAQPANPESLEVGKDTLNSMLASWLDEWGIDTGAVPLNVIGGDLSEPLGARMHIEYNLAMALYPDFPGSQMASNLPQLAQKGFDSILTTWGDSSIPNARVRGTLPRGQGNKRGGNNNRWTRTFFKKGTEIG